MSVMFIKYSTYTFMPCLFFIVVVLMHSGLSHDSASRCLLLTPTQPDSAADVTWTETAEVNIDYLQTVAAVSRWNTLEVTILSLDWKSCRNRKKY